MFYKIKSILVEGFITNKNSLTNIAIISKQQLLAFGIILFVNYPLYYFIWLYEESNTYESLTLRLIASGLCLPLIFNRLWPKKLLYCLTIYWYITACFCLPFFFTFMLLKNHCNTVWLMNSITALFFVLLLFDALTSLILIAIGAILAYFAFASSNAFVYQPGFMSVSSAFATFAAAIVIGTIFARNKQVIEAIQRRVIRAESVKSEFLANMSHDIRTPIMGMVGMIYDMQLMCDQVKTLQAAHPEVFKNSNPAILKVVETIESIAEDSHILMGVTDELLQFFNEILEVIRLESGQLDYKVSSFNLHELVEHNCELLQSVARHKNIALSFKIDMNVPAFITGFRMHLDHVILNLVSNALKFTSTGSVEILVSLQDKVTKKYSVGDSVILELKVKDTGIGIPKDKYDVIFEHFSRLSSSYNGLYKGAGMGLYTVKQYVAALQGNISLERVVNEGTCFTVTAPFVIADHSDYVEKAKQSIRPNKPASQKIETNHSGNAISQNNQTDILIVEDSPIAALTLKKYLTQLHCVCDVADTGAKAVEMAEKNSYDLIFMDIGLPDFDGIEVTRRMRALSDLQKSQVPIIAVTGHGNDPGIRATALNAGMQEVMSKPANPSELEQHLEYFVFSKKEKYCEEINNQDIIDWEGMRLRYPDNADFIQEMIALFVVELSTIKPIIIETFAHRDVIELRKALHRIRGAISYLVFPELEASLEIFHQSVHENWDDQNLLQKKYDALIKAMDAFVKVASQL